jgi:type II secretory pathway pseudopilin PulG
MTNRRQAGDTIIEVLICMAILGFAMSLCYGIARRGLFIVRQAEEHSQSLQLAQGQLERFRAYLKANPTKHTDPGTSLLPGGTTYAFCVWSLNDSATSKAYLKLIPIPDNDPKSTLCAVSEGGQYWCEVTDDGDRCGGGTAAPARDTVDKDGFSYRAGIAYDYNTPGQTDQFYGLAGRYAVDGLTGNPNSFDVVTVPYRIHQ